jgi:hypothetical protein
LYVCERDFEQRHQQDFLKIRPERPGVPWVRPEQEVFINFCSIPTTNALAGLGTAGCMVAGKITPGLN